MPGNVSGKIEFDVRGGKLPPDVIDCELANLGCCSIRPLTSLTVRYRTTDEDLAQ